MGVTAETWRDVSGFEGFYQVSDQGHVRSLDRTVDKAGVSKAIRGKVLQPSISNTGYEKVDLYLGSKRTKAYVHRLVASAFHPNTNELAYVNHKDENKLNNTAQNLEWCTPSYNNTYGHMKDATRGSKRIVCAKDGEVVGAFKSQKEAARSIGVKTTSLISACCRGEKQTAYGYEWRFAYDRNDIC